MNGSLLLGSTVWQFWPVEELRDTTDAEPNEETVPMPDVPLGEAADMFSGELAVEGDERDDEEDDESDGDGDAVPNDECDENWLLAVLLLCGL